MRRPDRALGGSLLLPDPSAGRAALLGTILRLGAGAGCARPAQVPRRKRFGTLGMRRLRLHSALRTETESCWHAVPGLASPQEITRHYASWVETTRPSSSREFPRHRRHLA